MKKRYIILIICCFVLLLLNSNNICASNMITADYDFWGEASHWMGTAKESSYTDTTKSTTKEIIDSFENMINVVGTTAIVIATIVLGFKYMIGSVESKTSANESMITLLVACVFFFGWANIRSLLMPSNQLVFIDNDDSSYLNFVARIFTSFKYVANIASIGLIAYIGIRYIFAGIDGRTELKEKSVYIIVGIILVFATSTVLGFVSDAINETVNSDLTQGEYNEIRNIATNVARNIANAADTLKKTFGNTWESIRGVFGF